MKKERFISALKSITIISSVLVGVISFIVYNMKAVGPIIILLGFIPWVPLKISGRNIRSTGADIVFGAIDTGFIYNYGD